MATTNSLGLRPSFAVLPLISSSLTVFYAIIEPTIFVPFLRSADTDLKATNRVLRLWWDNFFLAGVSTIFTVIPTSIVAGVYALTKLHRYTRQWNLYAAGTAFALGHFAFAPAIARVIHHIRDEKSEESNGNVEWLKNWLRIHAWRTTLTDIPALVCFGMLAFGSV